MKKILTIILSVILTLVVVTSFAYAQSDEIPVTVEGNIITESIKIEPFIISFEIIDHSDNGGIHKFVFDIDDEFGNIISETNYDENG